MPECRSLPRDMMLLFRWSYLKRIKLYICKCIYTKCVYLCFNLFLIIHFFFSDFSNFQFFFANLWFFK
jgi:hypothetical protein